MRHTPWVVSCVCHAAYPFVFAFLPTLAIGGQRQGLVLVIYKTAQRCVGSGSNYVRYYYLSPLLFPRHDDRLSTEILTMLSSKFLLKFGMTD